LNFLGRLSGVATLTRRYAAAIAGTGCVVAHTRKTTPGLRALELQAVRAGGGASHRFGLDDAVAAKGVATHSSGNHALSLAYAAGRRGIPESVLLDNFSLDDLRLAVATAKGRVTLEASGGVTLETIRAIADTGVDVISVGALTHSAPVLDLGLDAV